MKISTLFPALITVLALANAQTDLSGSFLLDLEDSAIRYSSADVQDPVGSLRKKIDSGAVKLSYDETRGYLPAILSALQIPVSSQVLVFSKTSFQFMRITPQTPRSIYFGDNVYVGWVPGGEVVEISAADPQKGGVFYTLDQRKTAKPQLVRRDECLQCHASPKTLGVPGHLVRSVYTGTDGYPILQAGGFVTDHRSPMKERWGGWYVTGTHGDDPHMGNVFLRDKDRPESLDTKSGSNLTSLERLVDTRPFLTPYSDIVSLMVLEHQTRMHNLITRVSYETKIALEQQASMNQALGRPAGEWSDSTRRRIYGPSEVLLQYMLFADEAMLKAPVKGVSGYTADFEKGGPRDANGRSLREFDLNRRLFRYPCSFLVYSDAFEMLPAEVKEYLYRRLWEVLSGKDQSKTYSSLTASDRSAVLAILRDTKPEMAAYWKKPR
ncbi:MAG: hypothetical protein ABIZ80_07230 [Bryobacteraceae bacterium]